jgi:hypothetical protein
LKSWIQSSQPGCTTVIAPAQIALSRRPRHRYLLILNAPMAALALKPELGHLG